MTATLTFEQKYRAFMRRDSQYVGTFITAVKTTGIFCHPACTARKPKRENVEFFDTPREAIQHGYRPCKICRPMEPPQETPQPVQRLLRDLQSSPAVRLKDCDLRQRGLEPATIRRWFKKHHNMTFHAYQRMLRLNHAYGQLANGKSVAPTAYDAGYESLSGFGNGFRATIGTAPSQAQAAVVLHLRRISTPLGPMVACASQRGVCLCEFTDRRMLESEFKDLQRRFQSVILPSEGNPYLQQLDEELQAYFTGTRTAFDVPLDTPSTEFRQQVWQELLTIPYGQTRSYAEQARRIGRPTAVRAVASANGHNRIAILIPCHRVIGTDGSLTGYGGGLARKQWLLDFERKMLQANSG